MRIIAGRLGGRRLKAPPGRGTRPTSERVREATFAMLGTLDGEIVLDLYAGSGALGIEALSRGAARAVLVEREASALRAMRANLAALALAAETAEVRAADVRAALQGARRRGEKYDLVFIDPPYAHTRALAAELSLLVAPLLAPGARVVVESDRRSPMGLGLAVERERRYGDTLVTIHRQR